jgi:TATA-binding protein-associated factor
VRDVIKDEDVDVSVPLEKGKGPSKRKAADLLDDMQGMQGGGSEANGAGGAEGLEHLSARERNQLRRKQRKMQRGCKEAAVERQAERGAGCKDGARESVLAVTDQPQDSNKVVVESVVAEVVPTDPSEWPLGALCDELSHDIFDPCWEIRHGAAMALRDILKYHAAAAGRAEGTAAQQQRDDNLIWLEECTIRMLCVLALDRFGDYVSDPVVAPVRETCGQVLGVLLRSLTEASLGDVTRVLTDMQGVGEWEVRHGGMLGLKYLIAVRADVIIQQHLKQVLLPPPRSSTPIPNPKS